MSHRKNTRAATRHALRTILARHGYLTVAAQLHDLIIVMEDARRAAASAGHIALALEHPQNPGKLEPVTVRHTQPRTNKHNRRLPKIPMR